MGSVALVSVFCADRVGLVSAIADDLFSVGVNLRDAAFAALGAGGEFTAVCELPGDLTTEEIAAGLRDLPQLAGAEIRVMPFAFDPEATSGTRITHRVTVSGGDQLGLVARLAAIFNQHGANIVRMEARKLSAEEGGLYVTRFAVAIPAASAAVCLSMVANTAGSLGLANSVEETGV